MSLTPQDPATAAAPDWAADAAARLELWMDQRIPLPQMLRSLAEEHGRRGAPGLRAMANRIEAGEDLADAFQAERRLLPRRLRDQLAAAAASGNLRAALPAAAADRGGIQAAIAEVAAIVAYPFIILLLVSLILMLFSMLVIPEFASIYRSFGLDLPALTIQALIVARAFPMLMLGALVASAVLGIGWRTPGVDKWLHWLAGATPLFGRVWTCVGHKSLTRLLSAYTSAGVPASAALRATAAGLFDQNLADAARNAADRCDHGMPVSDSLAVSRHFDRGLPPLVQWGEANACLPEALSRACSSYDAQLSNRITLVRRLAPPLTLLMVATIVMLMVLALFLPLVGLISGLSG